MTRGTEIVDTRMPRSVPVTEQGCGIVEHVEYLSVSVESRPSNTEHAIKLHVVGFQWMGQPLRRIGIAQNTQAVMDAGGRGHEGVSSWGLLEPGGLPSVPLGGIGPSLRLKRGPVYTGRVPLARAQSTATMEPGHSIDILGTYFMPVYSEYSLQTRSLHALLLSLLLLLMSPAAVRATAGKEANGSDCAQADLNSQPVAVQLTRSVELVQATLHSPPSNLPASGCVVLLQFPIPEDARPRQAVWRDVEGRAVRFDGTPDPAHPAPLPLRLWIRPDGNLEYEVRDAGTHATHASLNLAVAWGTTAAANDLAVLDILSTAVTVQVLQPGAV